MRLPLDTWAYICLWLIDDILGFKVFLHDSGFIWSFLIFEWGFSPIKKSLMFGLLENWEVFNFPNCCKKCILRICLDYRNKLISVLNTFCFNMETLENFLDEFMTTVLRPIFWENRAREITLWVDKELIRSVSIIQRLHKTDHLLNTIFNLESCIGSRDIISKFLSVKQKCKNSNKLWWNYFRITES